MFSRLKCTYSQIDKLTASYHSASIWFSVRTVQTSSCLCSFVINEVLGKRFAVIIESGIGNLVKKWNFHDVSRSSGRVAADNNFWNFFVLDGNLNSLCFSLSLRRNFFCNVGTALLVSDIRQKTRHSAAKVISAFIRKFATLRRV